MKKYLILLAFILPFMAMGQKKQHGDSIPIRIVKNVYTTKPPQYEYDTLCVGTAEHMPTIDGNKNGVMDGTGIPSGGIILHNDITNLVIHYYGLSGRKCSWPVYDTARQRWAILDTIKIK